MKILTSLVTIKLTLGHCKGAFSYEGALNEVKKNEGWRIPTSSEAKAICLLGEVHDQLTAGSHHSEFIWTSDSQDENRVVISQSSRKSVSPAQSHQLILVKDMV
jgi:hypothetical protein